MSNETSHLLSRNMGNDIILLYVGEDREMFTVHKKLLCDTAEFFANGFNTRFRERYQGYMELPEDTTGAIALFLDYAYRGFVPRPKPYGPRHLNDLYHLYFFAEKICHQQLVDETMDAIQDVHDRLQTYVRSEDAGLVYGSTKQGSKLRKFCVDSIAHHLWENEENADEDCEERTTLDTTEVRKTLWEYSKQNFELFNDLLGCFENAETDPRVRHEFDSESRCAYHAHEGEDCFMLDEEDQEEFYYPPPSEDFDWSEDGHASASGPDPES